VESLEVTIAKFKGVGEKRGDPNAVDLHYDTLMVPKVKC